jgi:hypothetical protein
VLLDGRHEKISAGMMKKKNVPVVRPESFDLPRFAFTIPWRRPATCKSCRNAAHGMDVRLTGQVPKDFPEAHKQTHFF